VKSRLPEGDRALEVMTMDDDGTNLHVQIAAAASERKPAVRSSAMFDASVSTAGCRRS
jgi:hypothetical protein